MSRIHRRSIVSLAAVVLGAALAGAVQAQQTVKLDLVAQPLADALRILGTVSNTNIIFEPAMVSGLVAPPVKGQVTPEEALTRLLAGTRWTFKFVDANTVSLVPEKSVPTQSSDALTPATEMRMAMQADAQSASSAQTQQERSENSANAAHESSAVQEIIVTAQKREQRLIDVPMSIAAITGEKLEGQGVQDIHDLSYLVPSLTVRDTGPGQQLITIRGVGNSRGSGSLAGIYLDEAPVSSIPFSQIDLRVNDLARVEVLRGPQGTLYGEGSVGGTLRFITNRPELDRVTGSVNAALSSTEDADSLGSEVRGVINVPLVQDKLALRVAGLYENASGWIDQPDASREDINHYDLKEVRVSALWRPFDGLDVLGSSTVHRVDGGGQNLVTSIPPDASEFRNPVSPTRGTFLTDDYDLHNLTLNWDLGFANLVSATTYMDKKAANINMNVWQPAPATAAMIGLSSVVDYSARSSAQELRLSSKDGGAWGWTAGLFYRNLYTRTHGVYDLGFIGVSVIPGFLDTTGTGESESWAAFGDLNYALTERLKLGVGVRYYKDHVSSLEVSGGIATPGRRGEFDSFDPRLYATLALTQNTKLYANAATGFRSGGFNGIGAVNAGGPPTYGPEKLRSYEAGVKSAALEGRVRTNVSVFFSQYQDIQVLGLIPTFGVVPVTSNAGEAQIKGVEAEFEWRPIDRFVLALNGGLIDTEFTRILASNTSQVAGDRIPLVPKYTYALSATRTVELADSGSELAASLDYAVHDGSVEINRASGLLNPVAESDTLSFLNASVRLQRRAWSFELFGQNLLDDRDYLMPSNFGYNAQARPRTYGLRVGYKP